MSAHPPLRGPSTAPQVALLTIDASTAIWLLRAINRERQWSRDNSALIPQFVAPLLNEVQKAATSGQTRTNLGITSDNRQTERSEPAMAVTYGEAARRLQISPRTLRRWIAAEHVTPITIGRTKRIAVTELERVTAGKD